MRAQLAVRVAIALVGGALALGTLPAEASHDSRHQVVEGELVLFDPNPPAPEQCNGLRELPEEVPDQVADPIESLFHDYFEIDPSTWGKPFRLDLLDGAEANLDVEFSVPDKPNYFYATVATGGEHGIVPETAVGARVCLSRGSRVRFRYEAGVSVPPPPVLDEADVAVHSPNLRLLDRPKTPGYLKRLVFQGRHAVASSHVGFGIYRLLDGAPYLKEISFYDCRGGSVSSDISIWGDYVFQSIPDEFPYFPVSTNDYNRDESETCNNTDNSLNKGGIRVVDISDPRRPTQVKFFEFACGSMNHTLVPHGGRLYIYVPTACDERVKAPDTGVPHLRSLRAVNFQIKVLRFNPRNPRRSTMTSAPTLDQPGDLGHPGMQVGCHDITVFPARDLAACSQFFNEGLKSSLLDISDPNNPRVISHLPIPPESGWMSHAAFSWDGKYLVMIDNGRAWYVLLDRQNRCAQEQEQTAGMWIYDISNAERPKMVSEFTLPRESQDDGNPCTPWEINMIPTVDPNRRVAVVGWLTGGTTVIDFSHPEQPFELAFWQPPPISQTTGAYFYNGLIYAIDYWNGGIRVFELDGLGPKETKSYARRMNPQTQLIEFEKER